MTLDLLRLQERVTVALSLGESHFREFKSAVTGPPGGKQPRDPKEVCVDIAQTLVAFANADGGELLVGVEDDGQVTGVPANPERVDLMLGAPRTHVHAKTPLPATRVAKVDLGGTIVLYFSVPKGTEYVYLTVDGRCLQRRDRDSLPIPSETIALDRTEKTSREYDRSFVDGAGVDDLDVRLVHEVANRISKGMSAEKCLQHLDLAEFDGLSFRLRRAALLLFAREPNKWHPRSQVRLLKIRGTELKSGAEYNVSADQEVSDNILTLIETSWDLVRPHLAETRLSPGAVFKAQIIYPEVACREALINAIAHRDYSIEGRGIEVHVFDDRLTIVSPGQLLSSIRLVDLAASKGVHQSRNSFVTRVLREVGYMRELGEGMRRIYELMKASDLAPPDLVSDQNSFSLTLHHRYVYSKEERLWLEKFSHLTLSREQRTVIRLGYNNHVVSPKEIWDAVGIVDTDAYRKLVESLIQIGVLTRSIDRDRASREARRLHVARKAVPRYRIQAPVAGTAPPASSAVGVDSADESEYVRVFVGNIPFEVNEEELISAFERFGEVAEAQIPTTPLSRKNRGYAFVEFETFEGARNALRQSGKFKIGERTVYVQPAKPKIPSALEE